MKDEMDILREVGSIAAGHGSVALSELLGRRINLCIPSVEIVSCDKAPDRVEKGKLEVAVIFRLVTGLKGEAVFMLDEKNAFKLIGLSYKIPQEDKRLEVLTEVGISALKEIANIVTGAYLNAVGLMLKKVILTFPPALISGTLEEVLGMILGRRGVNENVLLIEALFEAEQENIRGSFYLVLSQESAADIRQACMKMLKELEG